jgi:hypothetical protein
MGRTLHFTLKKDGNFTRKEKVIMEDHSITYNNGKYKDVWTCENFWLSTSNYYPNWKSYGGTVDSWDEVNKRSKQLEKEFKKHAKSEGELSLMVADMLKSENLIRYHRESNSEVSGFCKVQGNEFNAALVYEALVSLSKKLPKCEIRLSDEGEYLLCAVIIKNGKVKPDLSDSRDNIQGWIVRTALASDQTNFIKDAIKVPDGMDKNILNDLDMDNPYGDRMLEYINLELVKIHTVVEAIRPEFVKQWGNDRWPPTINLHNINNYWYSPKLFARPVEPKDFEDYKRSAATLMGGFYGEYWKVMPDKDAETESYKAIGNIQNVLSKAAPEDATMDVLGMDEAVKIRQ